MSDHTPSRGLPLRNKAGEIRAWVAIDNADYAWASQHRWYRSSHGYVRRSVRGEKRYLHRELLGLARGDGLEADHRNGDRLDNRRCNLRRCTRNENMQNIRVPRDNRSGYRGVYWNQSNQGWVAQVRVDGYTHYLGTFSDKRVAAGVAARFRREHMPFSEEAAA